MPTAMKPFGPRRSMIGPTTKEEIPEITK